MRGRVVWSAPAFALLSAKAYRGATGTKRPAGTLELLSIREI